MDITKMPKTTLSCLPEELLLMICKDVFRDNNCTEWAQFEAYLNINRQMSRIAREAFFNSFVLEVTVTRTSVRFTSNVELKNDMFDDIAHNCLDLDDREDGFFHSMFAQDTKRIVIKAEMDGYYRKRDALADLLVKDVEKFVERMNAASGREKRLKEVTIRDFALQEDQIDDVREKLQTALRGKADLVKNVGEEYEAELYQARNEDFMAMLGGGKGVLSDSKSSRVQQYDPASPPILNGLWGERFSEEED